jgi:NCS1 family nucleobase:cation symporter-1
VIGILIMPWKLYQDPTGYIFTWLIGYSSLLGPIAGIMIADYHVWRRRQLAVNDLYRHDGQYRYTGGFSLVGFAALALAVLPNVPGFLVRIGLLDAAAVPGWLLTAYQSAWFVGFALGFVLYLTLRAIAPRG